MKKNKSKAKELEIILFSDPTEQHFLHYWKKAQEKGISQARFETLWFEAYNDFISRQAQDNFQSKKYKMAEILIKNGKDKETRNAGRKFLNKALDALSEQFGVQLEKLILEGE